MIEKFLDAYELKARVAPGLILSLPLLVVVVYAAPILSSWSIFAASGVCSLALLYGLSLVVRARGGAIEKKLWNSWGGPPSTRFMRHRDATFGKELKQSIEKALATKFPSAPILSPDEEARNPGRADNAIVDAFRQVRQFLRQNDPDGLWSKLNIEYGFCRNLLGSRMIWAGISLAAMLFAIVFAMQTGSPALNPASAICFLTLACSIYVGWFVLPSTVKRIGDTYAETAWMSFLQNSSQNATAAGK
jgi:hypothetical protein